MALVNQRAEIHATVNDIVQKMSTAIADLTTTYNGTMTDTLKKAAMSSTYSTVMTAAATDAATVKASNPPMNAFYTFVTDISAPADNDVAVMYDAYVRICNAVTSCASFMLAMSDLYSDYIGYEYSL